MGNNQINIKNTLFISAGAGSGKTYRLTNDLADFLSGNNHNEHNPQGAHIKPSEVIATTFTKVAAAEIKDRARQELLKLEKIQDATLLETSAIGTIHSVAQQFLNKYWIQLNSSPNQDVLSDEDKAIYRNQSLALLLDKNAFTAERDAIRKYFDEFQPTKDSENHTPELNPEFWAEQVDLIVHKATYYEIDDFQKSIDSSCDEIDHLFNSQATVAPIQYATYYTDLENELEGDALKRLHKFSKVPTFKGVATLYSLMKDETKKQVLASWLTCAEYGQVLKDCVKAVFKIAKAWIEDYENFKRRVGVIDYDDMEKGFYKLLEMKEVQEEIVQNYKLVLVDEFQDCNPIQLKIFAKLSEIIAGNSDLPYSSIWVGDPNQSIYAFRGSDTDLINRAKKAPGLSHDTLKTSYRSRKELVDYANLVFQSPYFEEYQELEHNPNALERDDAAIEQWEFQKADKSDKNFTHTFARHLKELVESKTVQIQPKNKKKTDEHPLQNIEYKDIAILAKTHSEIENLVKVLREEGIPASAPESNILDRAEVQLVLAILNLRENSKKEERPHELATLLRLWNDQLTEDILSERVDVVKSNRDWSDLHTTDLDPIRVALDHAKGLPLHEKITTIILELDLYDKVSKWGQAEAEVRRQNLMTLQAVAAQFVTRCTRLGIAPTEKEFTLYLQEAEINPEKDNTSDSVKVFTYHGSKGLEWPMVILYSFVKDPFLKFEKREFFGVHEIQFGNDTDLIRNYYIHYMPDIADSILEPYKDYITNSPIIKDAKNRTIDEQKRLFYVGATRARDYLIYFVTPTITGNNKNGDVRFENDFKWLSSIGLDSAKLFLQNIKSVPIVPVVPPMPREPTPPEDPATDGRRHTKKTYEEYPQKLQKYQEDHTIWEGECEKIREKEQAEQARREALKAPKPYETHDLQPLAESKLDAKYLHPSLLPKDRWEVKDHYSFKPIPNAAKVPITNQDEEGKNIYYRKDAFGSCIHNIFAVCPYDGSHDLTPAELDAYYAVAQTIISHYQLEKVITDVPALVKNLLAMFAWLKKEYGTPTKIVHEYPFNYPYGENQVVRGEIDLVYCTEKTDVIIDFKNFQEDPAWLESPVKDHTNHFVGDHYVAQLSMYREKWQEANPDKKIATYLYYDILGGVVKV